MWQIIFARSAKKNKRRDLNRPYHPSPYVIRVNAVYQLRSTYYELNIDLSLPTKSADLEICKGGGAQLWSASSPPKKKYTASGQNSFISKKAVTYMLYICQQQKHTIYPFFGGGGNATYVLYICRQNRIQFNIFFWGGGWALGNARPPWSAHCADC